MKRKWYHTADNTVLECPEVNYKYNRDTYEKSKGVYWAIAIGGLAVALLVICLSENSIVQTVAGAFLGGILSLVVWLFTIRQQDKMNYELASVDMHIMRIDEHMSFQTSKVKFINPEDDELVQYDSDSVVLRFMHLLQLCCNLYSDKYIDTSELKLKFIDGKEYTLEQYIYLCESVCAKSFMDFVGKEEQWGSLVAWNNYVIDWRLDDLKKKLIRYKSYILCGNAPENYTELKRNNKNNGSSE